MATSPAIDAGMDLFADGATDDMDGNPRPIDGNGVGGAQFDIGPDEYLPQGQQGFRRIPLCLPDDPQGRASGGSQRIGRA
jgi:hypothetical protein